MNGFSMQLLNRHPAVGVCLVAFVALIMGLGSGNDWIKLVVLLFFWIFDAMNAAHSLKTWRTREYKNVVSDSVVGFASTALWAYLLMNQDQDWLIAGLVFGSFCGAALDLVLALRRKQFEERRH